MDESWFGNLCFLQAVLISVFSKSKTIANQSLKIQFLTFLRIALIPILIKSEWLEIALSHEPLLQLLEPSLVNTKPLQHFGKVFADLYLSVEFLL